MTQAQEVDPFTKNIVKAAHDVRPADFENYQICATLALDLYFFISKDFWLYATKRGERSRSLAVR